MAGVVIVLRCTLTEPRFVDELKNETAFIGDEVEFKCELSVADAAVTWKKDGRVIKHDRGKYVIHVWERDHVLFINDVNAADAGQYSAVFNNNVTTTATLTVKGGLQYLLLFHSV